MKYIYLSNRNIHIITFLKSEIIRNLNLKKGNFLNLLILKSKFYEVLGAKMSSTTYKKA